MHSNVTIKNVSWPHFSWPTLYSRHDACAKIKSFLFCFHFCISKLFRFCFKVYFESFLVFIWSLFYTIARLYACFRSRYNDFNFVLVLNENITGFSVAIMMEARTKAAEPVERCSWWGVLHGVDGVLTAQLVTVNHCPQFYSLYIRFVQCHSYKLSTRSSEAIHRADTVTLSFISHKATVRWARGSERPMVKVTRQ